VQKQENTRSFGNTLIAGAGPAAIQTAVQLSRGFSKQIGFYNRAGIHADCFKVELKQNQDNVSLTFQGADSVYGTKIDYFFDSSDLLQDEWDTLILSTPSYSYSDVMESLGIVNLKRLKTIILISPNIGSNDLVRNYTNKGIVDVISMSTYYAATKHSSSDSVTKAHTKTFKKRIYIASSKKDSYMLTVLKRFLNSLGVEGMMVDDPAEAECRNITTYVHPALFMNAFTLNEVFNLHTSGKKYMYKLYPEGPITQETIRTMVALWKEVSSLVKQLGANPINLLQFLNDDNYPVPEECLSRDDIEKYGDFEVTKQEYLLYIRYSSILIDPFSKTDEHGRYFEFSAVPFKQASCDEAGRWKVPRIPFEDYQKLKVIYGISRKLGVDMPKTEFLINRFECECQNIENKLAMSESLLQTWETSSLCDIDAIMKARGYVS
jgi:staphylopine/pseudopaline/yersinopine synthase